MEVLVDRVIRHIVTDGESKRVSQVIHFLPLR
jgi:hypothetical protein